MEECLCYSCRFFVEGHEHVRECPQGPDCALGRFAGDFPCGGCVLVETAPGRFEDRCCGCSFYFPRSLRGKEV